MRRPSVIAVGNMNNGQNAAEGDNGRRKAYSLNIQVSAPSSTSCSFCWFVTTLYPTLTGMEDRDSQTYKAHLRAKHGLTEDIRP